MASRDLPISSGGKVQELNAANFPGRAVRGVLKAPVTERFFRGAALKTLKGQPQLPYDECTEEEALSLPAYYVGRYVAGILVETEKFDQQGRSQFIISYNYTQTKPCSSQFVGQGGEYSGT